MRTKNKTTASVVFLCMKNGRSQRGGTRYNRLPMRTGSWFISAHPLS
ncbi:hypothetical protein [Gilliamella sp. CG16]